MLTSLEQAPGKCRRLAPGHSIETGFVLLLRLLPSVRLLSLWRFDALFGGRAFHIAWMLIGGLTADALPIHPANIRAKVRQVFEKNSKIDDLETLDVLLLKGHQEFQETMNVWKMESHVVSPISCTPEDS